MNDTVVISTSPLPSDAVTDTNALIWYPTDSPRLTPDAKQRFKYADQGLLRIYIPIIYLVELIYLSERGRIEAFLLAQTLALISTPNGSYALSPLDQQVLLQVSAVPRNAVPDMPDRLVTATALALGLPLLTSDHAIQAAAVVPIIW